MNKQSEIDLVYSLLILPAGYDIDIGGIITVRRYEYPMWAVEWEEYYNPHDNSGKREIEVLEFEDPHIAAECFVELRHKTQVGLDMIAADSNTGYYLLGNEKEAFIKKYKAK